jgi:hypothetical protein
MNVIDWLLKGDESICFLVKKNMLNQKTTQNNQGYINLFLQEYNRGTNMWGKGLYGPKWTSSTYTLLELIDLETLTDNRMLEAYHKLRKEIVLKYSLNPKEQHTLDLCIVGMLLKIGAYLKVVEFLLVELIDYILYTLNSDGAWNCYFNYRDYHTSSLHTTINILEGLHVYIKQGYSYKSNEVLKSMTSANEFILKKKLFRSRRTNKIINQNFMSIHYPTRWYYDMFRAMEYFVDSGVSFDMRMAETFNVIKEMMAKGPIVKGRTYPGRLHFKFTLDDYKRINTYRMLKVIKKYDYNYYQEILANDNFV